MVKSGSGFEYGKVAWGTVHLMLRRLDYYARLHPFDGRGIERCVTRRRQ